MSRRAVTKPSPNVESAQITGTPRRPDFVRRRGLFYVLLLAYVALLLGLLALSIRQHHFPA